jgi:hypothetical protein
MKTRTTHATMDHPIAPADLDQFVIDAGSI